jgi:hypothetical protein
MMTTAITAVADSCGGGGGGGGGGSRGGGDGSGSATAASGVRPSHVERNAFTSAVSGRIDRDVAATELAAAYARCLRVLNSISQTDVVVLNGTDGGVERGADATTLTTFCRLAAVHDVTAAQERALENACIALTRCVSKDADADDCVMRGAKLAESAVGALALALSQPHGVDNNGDDRHTEGATAAQSRDGRDVGLRQTSVRNPGATDGVWLPLGEIGPGALARAEEITARAGTFGVANKWYVPPPPPPPPPPPAPTRRAQGCMYISGICPVFGTLTCGPQNSACLWFHLLPPHHERTETPRVCATLVWVDPNPDRAAPAHAPCFDATRHSGTHECTNLSTR